VFIVSKAFAFASTVAFTVTIFYCISRAKIKLPNMRRIEGLEAIEEAVGRATEMGRPLHYSTGIGAITDEFAPQTMAGLRILNHTANLCAQYNCDLINTVMQPLVFPLSQEMVKQGFLEAGKLDAYRDDMVRFISPVQFAYAAGTMELMRREKIAANIEIGAFYAEALLLAEAASTVGAIQIGGTARMYQLQYFVVACDYVLIGEEMFAADAYLSKDPVSLGCIRAQDFAKIVCIILTVLTSLLATFGSYAISDFLGKYGN